MQNKAVSIALAQTLANAANRKAAIFDQQPIVQFHFYFCRNVNTNLGSGCTPGDRHEAEHHPILEDRRHARRGRHRGANGTDAIPNGGAGSSGRPSAAVLLGRDWRTLLSDADGDRVSFELQANSGSAGDADVAEVS
jgi:hypothetical protein